MVQSPFVTSLMVNQTLFHLYSVCDFPPLVTPRVTQHKSSTEVAAAASAPPRRLEEVPWPGESKAIYSGEDFQLPCSFESIIHGCFFDRFLIVYRGLKITISKKIMAVSSIWLFFKKVLWCISIIMDAMSTGTIIEAENGDFTGHDIEEPRVFRASLGGTAHTNIK